MVRPRMAVTRLLPGGALERLRAAGHVVVHEEDRAPSPDVLTEATADVTWALILAACRRLGEGERLVRAGAWRGWGPTQLLGTDVHGKTLGIVGLGRIGQAVARRAAGFAMPVLHHTQRPVDPAVERSFGARPVALDDLLRAFDMVS